jgi:plasmid stability protein
MPNLSIKNVPDSLLMRLHERAARHHRSLQGELMALLSAAVEPAAERDETSPRTPMPVARRSGSRRIEEIAAEHRTRWKKPFRRGPLAVAMIRADRDAR